MPDRPQGRKRTGSGGSASVHKRGSGLGSGSIGNSGRGSGGPKRSSGGGVTRGIGGVGILAIIAALLFNNSGLLSGLLSSGTSSSSGTSTAAASAYSFGTSTSHTTYTDGSSSSADTTVSKKARDKYTTILGDGKDTVTILVYMCGADLESEYGMATSDLTEMAYATMSDQVNIIVETGGAKKWQTSAISSSCLQRWKVTSKSIEALDKNAGTGAMTDPDNLEAFIKWGVQEYPANRYELIFWDHGGGSVSGYGYDELYPNGSMSVDEIADALKGAGTKFDFVGFDACLMANYETAVALEPYADYLIASEESEPGTGWYYTDWLTTLAGNTSESTVEMGKEIVDTFISASIKSSSSSSVTLSVTDLAELEGAVTSVFGDFASELSGIVSSDDYSTVSDARSCTKEFAASSSIDQIDLIHFCDNLNTDASSKLASALRSAVKYNKTQNISNSYGISIYFPYKNTRLVSSIVKIYNNIGFDSNYTGAVKSFSTLAASGNIYNNNTQSSLFSVLNGSDVSSGSSYSETDLFDLLSNYASSYSSGSSSSGGYSGWGGWNNSSSGGYGGGYGGWGGKIDLTSLLGGDSSSIDSSALGTIASLLTSKSVISAEDLVLTEADGQQVLRLSEDDWAKIHDVALNVWIDDGEGYIDLGLDNIYEFNDEGDLIVDYDGMWLSLNGEPCAYYVTTYEYTDADNYTIEGYIPAYLNGQLARILVRWTADTDGAEVLGAQTIYDNGTESKGLIEITAGDTIDLICDYYTYDGEYQDSYYLGDSIKVSDEVVVEDINIENSDYVFCYRLTDNLGNARWTPAVSSN